MILTSLALTSGEVRSEEMALCTLLGQQLLGKVLTLL